MPAICLPSPIRAGLPSAILSPGGGAAPFSPLDLGASLRAWYKADAGTSSVVDGTGLSAWNDQSGSGANLAQGTGGKQPLYKAAIQNGLPIVRFDGTDDDMAATIASLSQPITVFAVVKASNGRYVGANSGAVRVGAQPAPNVFAGSTLTGGASLATGFFVVTTLINGASSLIRVDRTQVATGAAGAGNMGTALSIGQDGAGAAFFAGDLGEVAICAGDQTANFLAFENYLKGRWATA